MRKIVVIANREYQAAVRTKTFVISLLIMPVMMLASVFLQWLFQDVHDIADKKFVVIDRVGRPNLLGELQVAAALYNEKTIYDSSENQIKPRFVFETRVGKNASGDAVQEERYELSEQIRKGDLVGFIEILTPDPKLAAAGVRVFLRYQSNNPTYADFSRFVELIVTKHMQEEVAEQHGIRDRKDLAALLVPVVMEAKGLSRRDPRTGEITDASAQSQIGVILAPIVLMMLMFIVILMTATPMMQGVVEEKMQRIAEVLLGSVQPFQLMMGKLIGMTGVSLTIALVYLGGAYWAAHYYGLAETLTVDLILWYVFFQVLAGLMFGSLFIAVGAACSDLKETQNLMWPVMLLACVPMFMLASILREPNSAVVRGLSFFPFATPTVMIARQAIPPGLPWWEPALASIPVLATTFFCVWAGGRIFRVGILMQGKGARLGEIFKWVFRG